MILLETRPQAVSLENKREEKIHLAIRLQEEPWWVAASLCFRTIHQMLNPSRGRLRDFCPRFNGVCAQQNHENRRWFCYFRALELNGFVKVLKQHGGSLLPTEPPCCFNIPRVWSRSYLLLFIVYIVGKCWYSSCCHCVIFYICLVCSLLFVEVSLIRNHASSCANRCPALGALHQRRDVTEPRWVQP